MNKSAVYLVISTYPVKFFGIVYIWNTKSKDALPIRT